MFLHSFEIGDWPIPQLVDWHLARAGMNGYNFQLKQFFDRLNTIDSIPISLARWEMTGLDDEIRQLTASN